MHPLWSTCLLWNSQENLSVVFCSVASDTWVLQRMHTHNRTQTHTHVLPSWISNAMLVIFCVITIMGLTEDNERKMCRSLSIFSYHPILLTFNPQYWQINLLLTNKAKHVHFFHFILLNFLLFHKVLLLSLSCSEFFSVTVGYA